MTKRSDEERRGRSGAKPSDMKVTRRGFIAGSATAGAAAVGGLATDVREAVAQANADASSGETVDVTLTINGSKQTFNLDARTTLLDLLREQLDLTGTKVGCNHGQCGACTVLKDGVRINSCLQFVAMANGSEITTIEGVAPSADELHPMQEAFLEHDGFQCGYCTPGQIMSAIGCVKEGHASSEAEIREYMSGNLCRCGAYKGITEAIQTAKSGTEQSNVGGRA